MTTDGRQRLVLSSDVDGLAADAVSVDALARLQLGALRKGWEVRLENASEELRELLAFLGLDENLPSRAPAEDRTTETASEC